MGERTRGRPSFLSGVFLLSLSAMLVKVTGLLTKIPMMRLLGAAGMGYYNTAYEVYVFLFVLSTAGLPVALSILISERREERLRILRAAAGLFAALGVLGGGLTWLFADVLAARMGNPPAAACMRAVAPAVLFVCLAAALRGYYQGLGDMRPTAVSQILEALGKLTLGLLLAAAARRRGLPLPAVAAAGAMGLSGGTALSFLYLASRFAADRMRECRGVEASAEDRRPARRVLRRLITLAVPITLSTGVVTLTRLLDTVLILRRLQACGYTEAAVNRLYGAYSTMAVPIYSLLPALIGAVALPLVPGITHAREVGDGAGEREIVGTAFRLTLLLALPAAPALSAFSTPILRLLFGGEETVAAVAPLLSLLGTSVLPACLVTVTGAMLQAYRRPHVPLLSALVGSALKLISAWILLALPRVGMAGVPISSLICHGTVLLIDLAVLRRHLPAERQRGRDTWRILAAALLSVGTTLALWRALASRLTLPPAAFLPAVLLCVLLYGALILRLGVLREADVARFSHGKSAFRRLLRPHTPASGAGSPKKANKFLKTP